MNPLISPTAYEFFVYDLPNYYPTIQQSSLIYISLGTLFGKLTEMIFFEPDAV